MVAPNTVVSPKDRWTLISVLRQEDEWSLALGRWDNNPRLAVRWNWKDDPNDKGNPVSHGMPTWFILPVDLYETLWPEIPEEKRSLARDVLGIPDIGSPAFAAEAHRQSRAVAESPHAKEDQDFVDAVSDWGDA